MKIDAMILKYRAPVLSVVLITISVALAVLFVLSFFLGGGVFERVALGLLSSATFYIGKRVFRLGRSQTPITPE
jgi:hypothetical protein